MFEGLSDWKRIVVTGPHRSGTTICAQMIAHDTGKSCILEEAWAFRDLHKFQEQLRNEGVFQAPAMFWDLRDDPATLFVLMVRPLPEIDASLARQVRPDGKPLATPLRTEDNAVRKYESWHLLPLTNKLKITYETLQHHPLWVTEEKRRAEGTKWHHRRTK